MGGQERKLEARIEHAVNEIAHRERRPHLSAPGREVEDVGFSGALAALPEQDVLCEQARGVGRVRPLLTADASPEGSSRALKKRSTRWIS
jgi:hypothetical protein